MKRRDWVCGPALRATAVVACLLASGCAKQDRQPEVVDTPAQAMPDAQRIQSQTMAFADRYLLAMATAYDRLRPDAKTPKAQLAIAQSKLVAGISAIEHAVEINPLTGLMNMFVMVTLSRELAEQPWFVEAFGQEAAASFVAVLKLQEKDIAGVAQQYLATQQIEELRQVCAQWLAEHPGERHVISARLEDFQQAKQAHVPGQQIVASVFGILTLDPFKGLDPAVKQVEESRILAERMFFYMRHMPVLMSWQTDLLYLQMLEAPQVKEILADTDTVAGSTVRFTDATRDFSEVSRQFADSIEKFRVQLPEQQKTLVQQLNDMIAAQRTAALTEGTTQVAAQLDVTIKKLNDTSDAIFKQLNDTSGTTIKQLNDTSGTTLKQLNDLSDARIKQLNGVTDATVDRLYHRALSLVLITVGSILVACIVYRLVFPKTKSSAQRA